ncbi:MAG: hypothetical protein ACI89U_000410 [Gammaproteobacteria bacterium]|jgi:hypothetical protein
MLKKFHLRRKNNRSLKLDYLSSIFQGALGESPEEARILTHKWTEYRKDNENTWLKAATFSHAESMSFSNSIIMHDEHLLRNFVDSCSAGIVLQTIHMGDYLHCILKILSIISRRKVLIVRKKEWSREEGIAFAKISATGHEVLTIRHGPTAAKSVVGELRKGSIAVLLYDLSKRWGKTLPVNIFDNQLYWVSGPLQMALLAKSCVIPFYTFEKEGVHICELGSVRDYRNVDHKRSVLLHREMQYFANTAESYIRDHVVQWDHWNLVPEMHINNTGTTV